MDDDEYYNSLMSRSERTLDDVANDVRQYMSCAVENIIKLGLALQEGRDMHDSHNCFHDWCEKEFPSLHRQLNFNLRKVAKRFSGVTLNLQHLNFAVLIELSGKDVPEDLVEDFLSSEEPVKVKDVKEAKKEYKQIQELPEFADLREKVEASEITPRDAIKEKVARMPVVSAYNINEGMGAIKGISEMFGKRYEGTPEDAASVLVAEIIKGYDQDDIGMSIARDYVKWFLDLKQVLDLAEPALLDFMCEKPTLKVIN
jgi:hypothetical protein